MANSDRRVLRTKRHIREAFVQLLEEKSLTDITVTQLADLADIDRKTFYAHYQNVTDVYLELSKEVAEQLREVLIDVDSFEVDDFLESLNDIMLANLSFFKIITSKSADKFFLTDFIQLLRETLLLRYSELTFTSTSFLSQGIIGAYVDWLTSRNPWENCCALIRMLCRVV